MTELFERLKGPQTNEKTVLINVILLDQPDPEPIGELVELAQSAGAQILETFTFRRHNVDAKRFIGKGQTELIHQFCDQSEAELVVFNHALSPSQERNLSKLLGCRVIDRVRLILDIFALRARSYEGKLQVELAQLKHMSTRLVGGWTHLERQKGGIGLRGPGETQLERDRRMVHKRIKQLEQKIEKVRKQRDLGRSHRKRREIPIVVIVGYTNAGKSTLFNLLTHAEVYAQDQLFATLDTTLRQVDVPGMGECIIADTVGFIRNLPHELVAAFHATLEEACEADLLLHVMDITDEDQALKHGAVNQVLEGIGAQDVPCLDVLNKVDLLAEDPPNDALCVSAVSGYGMDALKLNIGKLLKGQYRRIQLRLVGNYGRERAQLFQLGEVLREHTNEQGELMIDMQLSESALAELQQRHSDIRFVENMKLSFSFRS